MTKESLEEMIEAHQAEIFRYLRFIGADYPLAEDLVQETFLSAFQAKSHPPIDEFDQRRAWLRRIARNRFIDHCRRRQRSPVDFSSGKAEAAEAFWQEQFFRFDDGFGCVEALEICLDTLSSKQRSLVDAFYAARRSREEIAKSLGITSDGVKMALRRIRQALADCIQKRLSQA